MQKRKFYYIHSENYEKLNNERDEEQIKGSTFSFKKAEYEVDSEDEFDSDLVMLVFPINILFHIDSVLREFKLKDDVFNFFQQCKDVISVPEEHQNEKGQGSMNFQSFFHNLPYSVQSINPDALLVLALDPEQPVNGEPRKYNVAGYMHLNRYKFHSLVENKLKDGVYFNMLRISEKTENGQGVYRRKKLFSLMYAVSELICYETNVDYIYASMGKENEKINAALKRSSEQFGYHFERIPFRIFGKVNFITGSSSSAKKLVNISKDKAMLRKFYDMVYAKYHTFAYFPYNTFEDFEHQVDSITQFSKSSGAWMIPDAQGNPAAATLGIHWGEYFSFLLQNPKGLFKLINDFKITEKILYLCCSVGEPQHYKTLQNGLIHHHRKTFGSKLTFLPSLPGDPYIKAKKGVLDDNYLFFTLSRKPEQLKELLAKSTDPTGIRLFIDVPLI